MAYVKGFDINGIYTIQTACIELQAPPNASTEGAVGLFAIDMSSPTKDVYKCVKVEGAIYTWELLSSGMSILNSSESGNGIATATFTYSAIRMTDNYVVKVGDLILDSKGYLYRINKLDATYCEAEYCNLFLNRDGVGISKVEQTLISNESGAINRVTVKLTDKSEYSFDVKNGQTAYELAVENGYEGTEEEWLNNLGYNSWLKGKAITQAEYDALPEDEKDKPEFMYVIKDAEINVDNANTATTAENLKLKKVVYDRDVNQVSRGALEVSLTSEKAYLVTVRYSEPRVDGVGIMVSYLSIYPYQIALCTTADYHYYCEVKKISGDTWQFNTLKRYLSNGTVEKAGAIINIYEM